MNSVSVLDREMFAEAEAARLLRVAPSTLHYWLEGGERRGKAYRPVIRVEPRGDRVVTWAEFVEAGLLRQYRRTHQVPMAELRSFIDRLRDKYGVPYPLANQRPFVMDRQLIREAQDEADLHPDFCLVAEVRGQLVLTGAAQAFLDRVSWDDGIAAGWRPHNDPGSPVLMSPDVRFGRPSIKGVSTDVLREHTDAGEDVGEVATAFGLDPAEVRWALAFENSVNAA